MEADKTQKKGSAPFNISEVKTISELKGIIVAAAKAVKKRKINSILNSFQKNHFLYHLL